MVGHHHQHSADGCYVRHGFSGYGVAAKLSRPDSMDEPFVKALAEALMQEIARQCMAMGAGCIGHIKSHIRTAAGTIRADTIGGSHGTYSRGRLVQPVRELSITVNTIVQGISEEAAKAATLEGMRHVTAAWAIRIEKEREHSYFDAFAPATPDHKHHPDPSDPSPQHPSKPR